MLSGTVPRHIMREGRRQLRISDEYESISDDIVSILKLNLKLRRSGLLISDEGKIQLLDLHDRVAAYVDLISAAVVAGSGDVINKAHSQGDVISRTMKAYRTAHLNRIESGEATPLKSLIFTDMLRAYRQIKDHAENIAEAMAPPA